MCQSLVLFPYNQIFVRFTTFQISQFSHCKFKFSIKITCIKTGASEDTHIFGSAWEKSHSFWFWKDKQKFQAYFWFQEQVHRTGYLSNLDILVWLLQTFESWDTTPDKSEADQNDWQEEWSS